MAEFTVRAGGAFARLNGVLGGAQTPPIPYAWSGSDVLLKSGKFNEPIYLNSKLKTVLARPSSLTEDQLQNTFKKVVSDNQNILFEMQSCASRQQFDEYDAKFNLLLEAAIGHAENEQSLRTSKENLKNSLQISDSWMTACEVNKLMKLTSSNPAQAPDPRKFVPKHRR